MPVGHPGGDLSEAVGDTRDRVGLEIKSWKYQKIGNSLNHKNRSSRESEKNKKS